MNGSIVVNGLPERRSAGKLDELLARLGYDRAASGIAVALNGRVVPRARWSDQAVEDGDEIDIVSAVQGG